MEGLILAACNCISGNVKGNKKKIAAISSQLVKAGFETPRTNEIAQTFLHLTSGERHFSISHSEKQSVYPSVLFPE